MIQPARMLPSNAPPLPDADSVHSSRVLQEHSGGQYSNYSHVNNADQKYPASLLNENVYSGPQVPQPQHVYQQSAIQRRQIRHSQGRYGMGTDDQARIAATARNLYNRFRASDHYMKYRNRQHKDDKNGQADQKWPDRLEVAFFQALVRWPPMGRRKTPHKDKLRGRNELIADYIEELTGEARTRKQVSSHIQVLKPFVKGDPYIMKWLSKDDLCGPEARCFGIRAPSYHDGRRASAYHVGSQQIPAAPAMSSKDTHDIKESKAFLEVFEPTNFQMFVQRKYIDSNNEETIDRLHTYTKSITNPLQKDEQSPDWQSFGQDFPLLARIHQQRPLDCNVLLADASLAFPTKNFKDAENKALPGVELGISFLCSSRHLPVNAQVVCLNNFFRNGQILKEHCGRVEVHLAESEQPQTVDTQLKFGSTFWAKTLGTLASVAHQHVDGITDTDAPLKEQVRGITATQEVAVQTDTGYERLLVICWNFRLSSAECGRAYWRPLRLPPTASSDDYSDHPPQKSERVDSVHDNYSTNFTYTDAGASSHPYITTSQPLLQSPFEYDSSSGPTSALTSATWPSIDDTTDIGPQSAIDRVYDNNAFDFSGGNINISYDPALVDFSTFDSSAFNFDMDPTTAATNTADFSTDPALQDFSQPEFHTQWDTRYHDSFADSQLSAGASSFHPNDSQSQNVFGYGGGGGQYDPSYDAGVGPTEGQAYEGAASVGKEGSEHANANALAVLTGLPSGCGGEQYHGLPTQ